MRYMEIPKNADVQNVPNTNGPVLTFADFFMDVLITQLPRSNATEISVCATLVDKFADAKAGDEVELADKEHEALEKGIQAIGLPGRLHAKCLPFYSAIYEAPAKSRTAN